ncbi:hypothetical protein BH20CHL8_BH20CHL8_06490 [soil metagenome]
MTSLPILGLAAILPPIVLFAASIADGGHGLWNDFTSYWLAGRLVAAGETPYDIAALAALGAREGIAFEVGTGYSYPLPFAVAMVPLSALSFTLAASLFTAASLLLFGLAVASWLRDERVWRAGPAVTLGAALAAGLYTPVHRSLFFGQANLLVFAGLALGVRLWLGGDRRRDVIGGIWIGLVGIVKVAPLALALPLLLARRVAGLVGIGAGAAGAMLVAAALAPSGLLGMDRLVRLGEPDPYWTNQSINGFASRLTIGSDRVVAILPGVDARLLGSVLLVLFGIATMVVLVRSRRLLEPSVWIGLAIALALVAATAGAPKNSFWNQVPALIGAGLLLAPITGGQAVLRRSELALLAAWYGLAMLQWWLDSLSIGLRSFGPAGTVLSSAALYGVIALWAAIGSRMLRPRAPRTTELPAAL